MSSVACGLLDHFSQKFEILGSFLLRPLVLSGRPDFANNKLQFSDFLRAEADGIG